METVEVIEHRTADTMRYAGISDKTRELLIMLSGLQDIENSFCNWKNKYGLVSDNETDQFIQLTTKSAILIQESIIKSINDNLAQLDFKEI